MSGKLCPASEDTCIRAVLAGGKNAGQRVGSYDQYSSGRKQISKYSELIFHFEVNPRQKDR